jgi:hypothetical protein
MDRIHRLGQRRPVQAIKLVVEDSIECRIVQVRISILPMLPPLWFDGSPLASGKKERDGKCNSLHGWTSHGKVDTWWCKCFFAKVGIYDLLFDLQLSFLFRVSIQQSQLLIWTHGFRSKALISIFPKSSRHDPYSCIGLYLYPSLRVLLLAYNTGEYRATYSLSDC